MTEPYIKRDTDAGVATLEFFHPKGNSLPSAMLKKLAATITDAGDDEQVKVIVLRSGGERAFCAGASFDELVEVHDAAAGERFFLAFAELLNAMRRCPKFIIARVHGKAVGGGVGVVAAADYCIAARDAAVKLSELGVGIGAFVIGPAVTRKVGVGAFTQLTLNADKFFDADWAREKGLYAEVVDAADLDAAVADLAKKLAAYNPDAMRELKKIFWRDADDWDKLLAERAATSGRLAAGNFTQTALAKYKRR